MPYELLPFCTANFYDKPLRQASRVDTAMGREVTMNHAHQAAFAVNVAAMGMPDAARFAVWADGQVVADTGSFLLFLLEIDFISN